MIRFTLKQLSYFVATAEHSSTLKAARALSVSQPAVSMAIKHLEDTFGQRLFVRRHAQGVTLTPFGRRKLGEARHLIDCAYTMSDPEGERLSGHLEVGLFATLAPLYAPGLLRAFREAYPDIVIGAREATLDDLHRDLDSGTIELALLYDLDMTANIRRVPLGDVSPYALLPQDHPLSGQQSVSVRDLARHPFVLIDLPGSRDAFLSIFRTYGVHPPEIIRCGSLEMVRGLVASGAGLSILVTRPAADVSYDGQALACRPLRDPVARQRVILATAAEMPPTHIAQAFVETSRAYFAKLLGPQPPPGRE